MTPELATAGVYTDFQGLTGLKAEAKQRSPEAVKAVAKQFEALFLQMMLKSMRQASGGDPMFDNEQTDVYRDMYDKQLALEISEKGRGVGLAEMLVKQLQAMPEVGGEAAVAGGALHMPGRRADTAVVASAAAPAAQPSNTSPAATSESAAPGEEIGGSPSQFVHRLMPLARRAAAKIGVAPEALVAQAALETGWGKAVIRHGDGSSSHNLFNIKADHRWGGAKVAKQTLEYRDGVAAKEVAQFRSYDSYAASFDDYVQFLKDNPRYADALRQADDPKQFAQALQDAGYATDPSYANKIVDILGRDVLASAAGEVKVS